jgi:subtilase family serine protease
MAPRANIVLVVASTSSGNDINSAESKAIPMFPGAIMSQSFGVPEALVSGNNAQIMQADKNYGQAKSLGWTVFASAGDSGATNGFSTPNANFPSSDPLVTAVGGTMGNPYFRGPIFGPGCQSSTCSAGLALYDNSTGACAGHGPSLVFTCPPAGYGGEQVWNEPSFAIAGNLATGGGAPSLFFPVPIYQSGLGLASRTTPDVSYNAAVNGGVLAAWSACSQCFGRPPGTELVFIFGGTSAGSPQWAAIAALAAQAAGHPLGFINPAIYSIGKGPNYANDFHDITVGNNQAFGPPAGFNAAPGWDDATGWGTPNVTNLVADLSTP